MVSAVGIAPGGKEELPKLSCLGLRERIAWLEATEKAGVLRESGREPIVRLPSRRGFLPQQETAKEARERGESGERLLVVEPISTLYFGQSKAYIMSFGRPPSPPKGGRVERLFRFSDEAWLASRTRTLQIGAPAEKRPNASSGAGPSKLQRLDDDEEGGRLLVQAQDAIDDPQSVPAETIRSLQVSIIELLDGSELAPALARRLRQVASRRQNLETARDAVASRRE